MQRLPHLDWHEVAVLPFQTVQLFVSRANRMRVLYGVRDGSEVVVTRGSDAFGSGARVHVMPPASDVMRRRLVGVARAKVADRDESEGTASLVIINESPADAATLDALHRAIVHLEARTQASLMDIIGQARRPPCMGPIDDLDPSNGIAYSFLWASHVATGDDERARILELDTTERLDFALALVRAHLAALDEWLAPRH